MDRDRPAKSDFLHLGVLAGVGLLVGICLILSLVLISNDGVFYIGQARHVISNPSVVARRHPPGYPFLVWAAHALASLFVAGDSTLLWVRSAQGVTLLCRLLALVPLYFLGKRLVGPRDSFLALLILVVLPYPAYYGSDVLREWPYVLFLSLGFWLLYRGLQEGTRWPFAGAGLAAGLGYLIRPECAQLLLYGALGLLLAARHPRGGHPVRAGGPDDARMPDAGGQNGAPPGRKGRLPAFLSVTPDRRRARARWGAGFLLMAGFAIPAAPCIRAVGTIVPQQLTVVPTNAPPVILRAGLRPAGDDPLEFEVRAGDLLEVPIEAFDPEDQPLTFSLVGVPVGARPVYQFRSVATGAPFWTRAGNERDTLLTTYCPRVWQYEGIACYAYTQAGPQAGLQPVHRFWSPVRQRHFYTISDSEKEALRRATSPPGAAALAEGDWQYEGIVFYAFPAGHQPPDAVPVYRLGSEPGIADFGWQIADARSAAQQSSGSGANPPSATSNPSSCRVAWYVHGPGQPPAGARVEEQVLRWRPRADQQGEYQINIVVSDGHSCACQLVKVRVQPPAGGAETRGSRSDVRALNSWNPASGQQYAGVARLPEAIDRLFAGIAEDLMVVFFVPWLLGLYYRLRYQADRAERVLVSALLLVNVAAMLARYTWIGPGDNRRYGLGLLALTVFYIPTGLRLLAGWLTRLFPGRRGRDKFSLRSAISDSSLPQPAIIHHPSSIINAQRLLLAVGLVTCIFRFFMTPKVDKSSYRVTARWLQANTAPNAAVAVPDIRISFYAGRPAVFYKRQFDPRRADYAVKVEDRDPPPVPAGWRREYSLPFNRGKRGKTVVVYRIEQAPS
jgi:hypothetical protein